jgi:solute carrier family 25 protein 42
MGKKPETLLSFSAGAGAGVVARTCIAPIERIKILFQVARGGAGSSGYLHIAPRILRDEGMLAFWKGNTAAVMRVAPYNGVTFVAFEEFRASFAPGLAAAGAPKQAATVLAGTLAGVTAVATTYPLDLVRAAMATPNSRYPSMFGALRTIARERGVGALYAGFSATLLGVAPYAGLKFGAYEALKGAIGGCFGLQDDELRAWQRVSAGALAGLLAQTAVYPLDVVRRRMQTHEGSGQLYRSPFDALRTIAREEGVRRGLYRGLTLNYLKTMCAAARRHQRARLHGACHHRA